MNCCNAFQRIFLVKFVNSFINHTYPLSNDNYKSRDLARINKLDKGKLSVIVKCSIFNTVAQRVF